MGVENQFGIQDIKMKMVRWRATGSTKTESDKCHGFSRVAAGIIFRVGGIVLLFSRRVASQSRKTGLYVVGQLTQRLLG